MPAGRDAALTRVSPVNTPVISSSSCTCCKDGVATSSGCTYSSIGCAPKKYGMCRSPTAPALRSRRRTDLVDQKHQEALRRALGPARSADVKFPIAILSLRPWRSRIRAGHRRFYRCGHHDFMRTNSTHSTMWSIDRHCDEIGRKIRSMVISAHRSRITARLSGPPSLVYLRHIPISRSATSRQNDLVMPGLTAGQPVPRPFADGSID